jgi:hypothetical protein
MSAAATSQPSSSPESRSGRLLGLIRKLIDYGRELVATIGQRVAAEPLFAETRFGTADIAVILERIARGLRLAEALEARVLQRAAWLDKGPRAPRAKPASSPTAPRVTKQETEPPAPNPDPPDQLPSVAQIAAAVRRRPIGAVISDICRDLGIMPSHPLWREVQMAIIGHGGSLFRLMKDILYRGFPRLAELRATGVSTAPSWRFEPPCGTGPPAPA